MKVNKIKLSLFCILITATLTSCSARHYESLAPSSTATEVAIAPSASAPPAMATDSRGSYAKEDGANTGQSGSYGNGTSTTTTSYNTSQTPSMAPDAPITAVHNLKIIKNANVSLVVENFDEANSKVRQSVLTMGGYIESSNAYVSFSDSETKKSYKTGNLVLKIPSQNYDAARESLWGLGEKISESENTQNVTAQYIDTDSRVKVKQIEYERVLGMLEKAQKLEDVVLLEDRLTQIRNEIESSKSQLLNWDRLVEFSTINVTLSEKTPEIFSSSNSLLERMKSNFMSSIHAIGTFFQWILLLISMFILPILMIIIILVIVLYCFKKFITNKKLKTNKKGEDENEKTI